MIFIIFCMFFVSLITLNLAIDVPSTIGKTYEKIKDKSQKAVSVRNVKHISTFLQYTKQMLEKSNISAYFNYTMPMHFLICLIVSVFAFIWISQYVNMILSFTFSVVAFITPYIILSIIQELYIYKERKSAVDFLIILKNFLISEGDIFEAFRKVITFIPEPLKSYVTDMVYKYDHKINSIDCLNGFEKNINLLELKNYIKNLKICLVQGGDSLLLTDTFIEELTSISEDEDKENAEDKILSFGLYFLIILNFGVVYWIIKSTYREEMLGTVWGQVVFLLDMLISAYIMYLSLKRS